MGKDLPGQAMFVMPVHSVRQELIPAVVLVIALLRMAAAMER